VRTSENPLREKLGELPFHARGWISPLLAQACRGSEPVDASPRRPKAPAQEKKERSRLGTTYQAREKNRKKARR
jgi:hypothetical protein